MLYIRRLRLLQESIFEKFCISPIVKLIFVEFNFIRPWHLTLIGLWLGILSSIFIVIGSKTFSVILLIFSGGFDALDGAYARLAKLTCDKGAVLDIISDRVVEFSVILALFLVDPAQRSYYVVLMLGATFLCVTSFLVVAVFTKGSGKKSFFYSRGLMERYEAFVFFICMIILPQHFNVIAMLYSLLVAYTGFMRVFDFCR